MITRIMRGGGGDSTPESRAGGEETAHQDHARGWRRQHTKIMRAGGGDSTPESCARVEETAHQNRARGWRRQHTRIMDKALMQRKSAELFGDRHTLDPPSFTCGDERAQICQPHVAFRAASPTPRSRPLDSDPGVGDRQNRAWDRALVQQYGAAPVYRVAHEQRSDYQKQVLPPIDRAYFLDSAEPVFGTKIQY